MVSAHVVDYKAAQVPPLATATPDIENKLKHDKAVKLAAADGAQKLAALQKGEAVEVKWLSSDATGSFRQSDRACGSGQGCVQC